MGVWTPGKVGLCPKGCLVYYRGIFGPSAAYGHLRWTFGVSFNYHGDQAFTSSGPRICIALERIGCHS